jgi:hypothetical protein
MYIPTNYLSRLSLATSISTSFLFNPFSNLPPIPSLQTHFQTFQNLPKSLPKISPGIFLRHHLPHLPLSFCYPFSLHHYFTARLPRCCAGRIPHEARTKRKQAQGYLLCYPQMGRHGRGAGRK